MSGLRTAIYVAVSFCLVLLGVAVLAWSGKSIAGSSIATSLVAGGISSIAFSVIRYFDERSDSDQTKLVSVSIGGLAEDLHGIEHELQALRDVTMVSKEANERRVFDRHPEQEVRAEIDHHRKNSQVNLDVMGLSLRPFYGDFMDYLIGRENVNLRLIVQEPCTQLFSLICHQEARDEAAMARDVLLVTRRVLGLLKDAEHEERAGHSMVDVRWFPLCPSVSLTRINDLTFVRSRYLQEALHPPMFFERYHRVEGRCFDAYKAYFEKAWELSITPTKELCEEAEAKLQQR